MAEKMENGGTPKEQEKPQENGVAEPEELDEQEAQERLKKLHVMQRFGLFEDEEDERFSVADTHSDQAEPMSPTTANRISKFKELRKRVSSKTSIIELMKREVTEKMERKLEHYKRDGIHPKDIVKVYNNSKFLEINYNQQVGEKKLFRSDEDLAQGDVGDGFDISMLTDYIVIDHRGTCYRIWYVFISVCQICSSYYYCLLSGYRREAYPVIDANFFEVFFLIDIFVHFLLDYLPSPTATKAVRQISEIIPRYVKSDEFIIDIIPIIPL